MRTKPLDRLMFFQGEVCFFCKQPLAKSAASVEHLVAATNGGSNTDENCVACCKSLNAMFGSKSIKQKFEIVLNQKGQFKCPYRLDSSVTELNIVPESPISDASATDIFGALVANLKSRGNSAPRTLKTLASTIKARSNALSDDEVRSLIHKLESSGRLSILDGKVSYQT
jgi:hypothetical protein